MQQQNNNTYNQPPMGQGMLPQPPMPVRPKSKWRERVVNGLTRGSYIGRTLTVPKKVVDNAIITYILALTVCNVLFSQYVLPVFLLVMGTIEVISFFYFSYYISRQWVHFSKSVFTKRLIVSAVMIRLIYVLVAYIYDWETTGTAFNASAGDALWYDEMGRRGAQFIRDGKFVLQEYGRWSKSGISDIGYPIYMSIVYLISGDSIFVARLLKVLWSAWTVLLIYRLASRNFGEKVGRIAAILCMLMPNLIYYCGQHLKETEMVFLTVLFVERADYIIRKGKLTLGPTIGVMLIPLVLFTFRTVLAATLVIAFLMAVVLSSNRVISFGRRFIITLIALAFAGVVAVENTDIVNDVRETAAKGGSGQQQNIEWRSTRSDGGNIYAKYASAAVFAPLIFTIPFPTMNYIDYQFDQILINGGNFDKNITSYFTIIALIILVFSGRWREHVLPLAVLVGYLTVLVFSNFAHSERFHMPILPLSLMFAAYGMSYWNNVKTKSGYMVWVVLLFIAAVAWNWFKLSGKGMI